MFSWFHLRQLDKQPGNVFSSLLFGAWIYEQGTSWLQKVSLLLQEGVQDGATKTEYGPNEVTQRMGLILVFIILWIAGAKEVTCS